MAEKNGLIVREARIPKRVVVFLKSGERILKDTKETEKIIYWVSMGKKFELREGEKFIPHPAIEEEFKNKKRIVLGDIEAKIDKKIRLITWGDFMPYRQLGAKEKISGKRIGTLLQALVVSRIRKEFPKYRIRSNPRVSDPRKEQLGKIGIDWRRKYAVEEYYAKTRDYLKDRFKKFPLRTRKK